jgi:hypothetical protein
MAVPTPAMPMERIAYDRSWFLDVFRRLLTGWHQVLLSTSASGVVWQSPGGIRLDRSVSRSRFEFDGVTRLMPALAAWAAQAQNGEEIQLLDGKKIKPKEILHQIFTRAFDPEHPDFWEYAPGDRGNPRQVESSIVAWSLWLSRSWLIPLLSAKEISQIQKWLASCTTYTDHFNNWSLFTAVNHAVRIALEQHGFKGDRDCIRRDLIVGDEVGVGDGWLWDKKYHGIDYYNFLVWGSHHCYLKAILPGLAEKEKDGKLHRAIHRLERRLRHLGYLIDSKGQNILFGRSLSYRWGWLNAMVTAYYVGIKVPPYGLGRAMLGKNIQSWIDQKVLNENGVLSERLTPDGSEGGRDSYINCGHSYWGMQSFLCLAFPAEHDFWNAPQEDLPVDLGDYEVPVQGPGFCFQGFKSTGEVRLFNLRNLDYPSNALYQKFVYSSAFPANCDSKKHLTLWDNQLGIRKADGSALDAAEVMEVDVEGTTGLWLVWRFAYEGGSVTVRTTIQLKGEVYRTEHRIEVNKLALPGACWVEGGFALGHSGTKLEFKLNENEGWSELAGQKMIFSRKLEGWKELRQFSSMEKGWLSAVEPKPNIIFGHSTHFYLTAPLEVGSVRLCSEHAASLNPKSLKVLLGIKS